MGTHAVTKDGRKSHWMVFETEILLESHNMVVVTSPTGLQAPPALAAMTTKPPMV